MKKNKEHLYYVMELLIKKNYYSSAIVDSLLYFDILFVVKIEWIISYPQSLNFYKKNQFIFI